MDAMVTARVPAEIKEQGNAILKKIGSSPTELVNVAYEYVLRHGKLPEEKHEPSGVRSLTVEQRKELIERTRRMTLSSKGSAALPEKVASTGKGGRS